MNRNTSNQNKTLSGSWKKENLQKTQNLFEDKKICKKYKSENNEFSSRAKSENESDSEQESDCAESQKQGKEIKTSKKKMFKMSRLSKIVYKIPVLTRKGSATKY